MAGDEIEDALLKIAAQALGYFLANCAVWHDGTVLETRRLVDRVQGVKIHVYADEHPPPHFHVDTGGKSAAFTIAECKKLYGDLGRREERIVQYWFQGLGKEAITEVWNQTRPGGCTVGCIEN